MMSVFAAFILMDEQFIKVMGFALATAVLFDAFIIRMTFIPAVMFLLGERAWKIPKWLDRLLPVVDVEGEALQGKEPKAAKNKDANNAAQENQVAAVPASEKFEEN